MTSEVEETFSSSHTEGSDVLTFVLCIFSAFNGHMKVIFLIHCYGADFEINKAAKVHSRL